MSERRNGAVTAIGESALTGWRGAVGKAVAKPIAKRTRFSEQDIRVALGLVIIAYTLYRILRPTIRALRSSR
jgi:hypothetical protein